jgi:hypothetical protein
VTRAGRLILAGLAAVAISSAVLAGGIAAAELSKTYDVGVAECKHATSDLLCDQVSTVDVQTEGVLRVQFTAAATHCAPVIVHLSVDGAERFVSGPLGPGESAPTQDFGPIVAGSHTLGVQAEGVIGGCNAGTTSSWGGQLAVAVSGAPTVTPTPPPAAPTPTPAPQPTGSIGGADYTPLILGFAGLVAIGATVTWYSLRRDRTPVSSAAFPTDPHRDAVFPTDPHRDAAYPTDPHRDAEIPPNPIVPPDQDSLPGS